MDLINKEKALLYLFVLNVIIAGCSSDNQSKDGLPYVDHRINYPEKELILTDIADVTYLCLNSDNDEYLYNGGIWCETENTFVVHDYPSEAILFFSKDGNPKSRFVRKGRGPQEFLMASRIIYDENNDDVFVADWNYDFIQVYTSTGKYKRQLNIPKVRINSIIDFDQQSLLLIDRNYGSLQLREKVLASPFAAFLSTTQGNIVESTYGSPFLLISKTDGAIIDTIKLREKDFDILDEIGLPFQPNRMIKSPVGVFLCNPCNDTVFLYGKDKSLTPVIYKIPPGTDSDPNTILNNCLDMGRYQFMELITVRSVREDKRDYPTTYLCRDKKSGEVFRYKIVIPEYKGKEFRLRMTRSNYEHGISFVIPLLELKEAYSENKLSGKLKELTTTLKDDDNDVYVMARFKK